MKRAITFHDFPCRPRRFKSESLVGYCYRLMSENGHHISAGGYYNAVRRLYAGDLAHYKEILQDLAAFIGEPSYPNDRFWEERSFLLHPNFNPQALSFPKLRANSIWLCAACMRENAFHREYWTMPLARTCPVHGLWLTTRCGVCDVGLLWSTLKGGWKCPNGHKIYDAQLITAIKPSTPRDQLVATHIHFGFEKTAKSLFDRYRSDATIHEIYVAYYWIVSPGRLGEDWLLRSPSSHFNSDRTTLSERKRAFDCTAPLSYAFIRWVYLWRIIMNPLGRHVPISVPILNHIVRRRPVRAKTASEEKLSKRTKSASSSSVIEFLYEHRMFQLREILVYLNDQVPRRIGLSALHHFNRWWAHAVAQAREQGLVSQDNAGIACQLNLCSVEAADEQTQIELALTTLLDHLLFCAGMLFSSLELKRFWSCFILPRSMPGSSRTPAHRRLAAYLMTRSLAELRYWNAQIETDLAQRHQEFCDELS